MGWALGKCGGALPISFNITSSLVAIGEVMDEALYRKRYGASFFFTTKPMVRNDLGLSGRVTTR